MNSTLKQLNLKKYMPFFGGPANQNYALGIYNKSGKQRLLECSAQSTTLQNLLVQSKQINWSDLMRENNYQSFAKQGCLYYSPLTLGANEQELWLFGIQESQQELTPEQQAEYSNSLRQINYCLTEDFIQAETIFGMAGELAIRYEELNLLYRMDDVDAYYKSSDEQETLQQLINNCVDYLNIDLAIIYLAEQDLCIVHAQSEFCLEKQDFLQQNIRQKLYPYITSNKATLVINRNNQTDWTDADLQIPYKLIVAPIVKINQSPSGLLVLLNNLSKLDFTNSDRKLAEVLAAEASKLTQARRDSTTGQLNRRGFTEQLDKFIQQEATNHTHCLLIIDIDQFKIINDTSGQVGGDHLLKQITTLLLKHLKKTDTLGRLGSDEFAIILKQCELQNATAKAEQIRLLIKQFRFLYQDKMFDISACIGVVELNQNITSFSQALSAADMACAVAKEQGRNRVHVYQPTDKMLIKHENEMQWVSRINLALKENRFQIYRQKIQELQHFPEREEHYEILIRLKNEDGEILSPFHFIPAAERYNMMPKLDRWVIKQTLKTMANIFAKQPDSKLICSINLSGQSFCEDGFIQYIKDQIKRFSVPTQRLCFEMTETAAVSNLTQAVHFMEELKAVGCQFSLDDFGSGMSSFTYLKNLPVDYLKIDGYFVKSMLENKIDYTMVKSIHQVGHVMGLKTIAEFVENQAIFDELKKMGINYGQGYGIGKPKPFI